MCSRKFVKLFVLFLLLSAVQLPCFSSSVTLTEEEATELLTEIQEAQTELQNVKNELTESKKDCQELKAQQEGVKNTLEEQKKYYEKQLKKAEVKNNILAVSLTAITIIAIVLCF